MQFDWSYFLSLFSLPDFWNACVTVVQLSALAWFIGMLLGSLLPQWVGRAGSEPDAHAALHHRAAAETHHTPATHH